MLPAVLGLAMFALYMRTLSPGVVGHDAGEFQFVPAIFGIPHAPGYPLYLLIGKAWSWLPLGSVAWRMNLLSAVFGAAAAALTALCATELTGTWPSGLIAGLAVGLAPLEWTWSTIAGVRSLAVAFVAAVVFAALRWAHTGSRRWFLALAATCGLALDHHRTIALLFPLLAIFAVWELLARRRRLAPRLLLEGIICFVAPLLLYGVLWLRAFTGSPWDQYNSGTWSGFRNLVLASADSSAHLDMPMGEALGRLPQVLASLPGQIGLAALLLAASGLIWLAFRRPAVALMLGGYIIILAGLTAIWDIGSSLNLVYFMPAYVPLAVLAGCALGWFPGGWRTVPGLALAASVALLGVRTGLPRFSPASNALDDFRTDLFDGLQGQRLAQAFAGLPAGSTVVANWDQATVLWYAQYIEHINPSSHIIYPLSKLPEVHASGPLFLAAATEPAPPGMTVSALGPFVQIDGAVTPAGQPVCDFGGQLRLTAPPILRISDAVLPVTLYWTALATPSANYSVSVRLVTSSGAVVVQRDEANPVFGLARTSGWHPGQVTEDYYELDTRGTRPGAYRLAVVVYQALPGGGFHNLSCGSADQATLGQVRVPA